MLALNVDPACAEFREYGLHTAENRETPAVGRCLPVLAIGA